MNKTLTTAEIAAALPVMTKRDKLLRLASIVRSSGAHIGLLSQVEYLDEFERAHFQYSLFVLASRDPILKGCAGMTSGTIAEGERFFGLTRNELHHFSCDCGGALTNEQMARRVEDIAAAQA